MHNKIFVYFFIMILIPVISLGTFSYLMATNFLQTQTENNQTQISRLIGKNIGMMLSDAQDISDFIGNNETIQSILSEPAPKQTSYSDSNLYNFLANLKRAKTYITFIILYGENGYMYRDFVNFYRQVIPYSDFKNSTTYMATAAKDGKPHWEFYTSPLFTYPHSYNEMLLGRRIVNIYEPDQKLGALYLGFNREAIDESIKQVSIGKSTNILLFDDNYNLVSMGQENRELRTEMAENLELKKSLLQLKNTATFKLMNVNYLTTTSSIDTFGWTVVILTPMEEITKQHALFLKITIVLSLSLLIVITVISALLSRGITQPVKTLLRSMHNFKRGDFNQQVTVQSRDEIGMLGHKYNEMVSELNDLIHKVYVSQTNQKMIELRNLQSQIEPHFLYNTLDFIFLNSKINGDNQTAEVVYSLSQLFRLSLNKGQDYYTVGDELKQIKAYIRIQHARFPNRFTPELDMDDAIEPYLTLKLVLQPIVENAILHAFNKQSPDKPGVLRICGKLEHDHIHFLIEDNGCGMPPDQVERLLEVPKQSRGGYGVRNVNERLQMLFGRRYALVIHSHIGQGTAISLRIPLIHSEEQWRELYESDGH
ncbi:cache domain-containing sensor histidine kinase [Paenibacillus thalictri]|uniref:cache domain-containing sensor histidine kinase n=1 Tax=Paenibacillus thalictri TaxID=2527873 RepID=UPI0013EF0CE8|nr:sensor histidine kinase [Paenibacillus thalictri]